MLLMKRLAKLHGIALWKCPSARTGFISTIQLLK